MVWMVLGGAEGWTSRAEEGVWEGGCWWWCSAYGWGAPRCGGFTLGRWCSPSAWGQGSSPGVRTGISSFCWVPPPARFPRGQKHPSLHVSCFSFKGVSQMMSAIFFSILLPLQRDVGVQGWSHQEVIQKNPKAGFVLHLVCVLVQQLCHSGLICLMAMEKSHSCTHCLVCRASWALQ